MRRRTEIDEVRKVLSSALETTMTSDLNLYPKAFKIAQSVWSAWESGLEIWAQQGVKADELWMQERGIDVMDLGTQHDATIHLDWDIGRIRLSAQRGCTSGRVFEDGRWKVVGIEHVVAAKKLELEREKAESDKQKRDIQQRHQHLQSIESEYACEIQLLQLVKQLIDASAIEPSVATTPADDTNSKAGNDEASKTDGEGQVVGLKKRIALDDKRIILVCMDPFIGFDPATLLEMRRYIESSRAIIPLIMPTYKIKVRNQALLLKQFCTGQNAYNESPRPSSKITQSNFVISHVLLLTFSCDSARTTQHGGLQQCGISSATPSLWIVEMSTTFETRFPRSCFRRSASFLRSGEAMPQMFRPLGQPPARIQ